MISNDSAAASQPSSSFPPGAKVDAVRNSAVLARSPVEVGSPGGGTDHDPGATDTKPLGNIELDLFLG